MDIGRVGIWGFQFSTLAGEELAEALSEVEALGYSAVWYPGGRPSTGLEMAHRLLDASRHIVAATGIVNIWTEEPATVAAAHREFRADHPGRFLLGLGVSHPEALDSRQPGRYRKPIESMAAFLDGIDAADPTAPRDDRVLAALGPRMLELAGRRAGGAHPYFVPVEHTVVARDQLGPDVLLAPEQAVVLATDATQAREIARTHMATYLTLGNYTSNLRRLGFTDTDLSGNGSDRLVDAIVAWGDDEAVAKRVAAHLQAGADHVCVQVLTADASRLPRDEWRRLSKALQLPGAGPSRSA